MKREDVRKNAYSMLLTSPSYPRGPYRFVDREFFVITYRTDPDALRAAVPEVLSGVHIITDLTLGPGEVVHDYLQD